MEKNRVKSPDMKSLKARKKSLKKEMESIQSGIGHSLEDVQNSISNRARFGYWADKYPLELLGTAFVTGFILARKIGRRKEAGASSGSSGGVFTGLLMDELKKMAVQRTIRFLTQRIENAIDKRSREQE